MTANPAPRGQVNRRIKKNPCSRSRLRIWAREAGSAVPSHVSPFILDIRAESGYYSRCSLLRSVFHGGLYLHRQPPSGKFQVNRVVHLRTDSVYRILSAGTRPWVLKVAQVTSAVYTGNPIWDKFSAPLFFHAHSLLELQCFSFLLVGIWRSDKLFFRPKGTQGTQ